MNNLENLKAISVFKPDYIGFIFYDKSPRNFTLEALPNFKVTKKIGVFVNEDITAIAKQQKILQLHGIQLHGKESQDYILNLKKMIPSEVEIFKAISIENQEDFIQIRTYENLVDLIILDTKTPLKGGSGKQFNWNLLQHYNADIDYLLSGGISVNDVDELKKIHKKHPKMKGVDINSKFELQPGLKSVEKVQSFINNIKN